MTPIFIVEDHAFTRDGLRVAINRENDLQVVGEARSAEEALEILSKSQAEVVLLDIGLPGMNGIELTREIKRQLSHLRVVIFTVHQLEVEVLAAVASGADAYCLKSSDPASLILALRAAALGSTYLDPQIAHIVLRQVVVPNSDIELSPRELQVLRCIADGRSNKEISQELNISLSTVKTHIEDVLRKLSASDRTQAAVKALKKGLL